MIAPPARSNGNHVYNWFPIHPPPLNSVERLVRRAPNLVRLDLDLEGVTTKLFGHQHHGAVWDIPSPVVELDVCITCCLNDSSGTFDYFIDTHPTFTIFPDSSFNLNTMPNMSHMSFNLNNMPNPNLSPTSVLDMNSSPISTSSSAPDITFLVWNVRGAGGTEFRRVFRDTVAQHKPNLVILTETRLSGERAQNTINNLGYEKHYKVDAMGFSGGLWMLWDPNAVDVDIIGSSFQEIHSHVKVSGSSFILSSLYASPNFDRRKLLWDSLSSLGPSITLPWILLGDFNDISLLLRNLVVYLLIGLK